MGGVWSRDAGQDGCLQDKLAAYYGGNCGLRHLAVRGLRTDWHTSSPTREKSEPQQLLIHRRHLLVWNDASYCGLKLTLAFGSASENNVL